MSKRARKLRQQRLKKREKREEREELLSQVKEAYKTKEKEEALREKCEKEAKEKLLLKQQFDTVLRLDLYFLLPLQMHLVIIGAGIILILSVYPRQNTEEFAGLLDHYCIV